MSTRSRKSTRRLIPALLLSALLFPTVRSIAATTIVVRPGSLGEWSILTRDVTTGAESQQPTSAGSSIDLVDGPSGTPAGLGSLRQYVADANDSVRAETHVLDGLSVGDLTEFGYWTYVKDGGAGAATNVQLLVDLNGDGLHRVTQDDVLTFEPVFQHGGASGDPVPNQCASVPGCVGFRTWQRWDAAIGGWWSARAETYGPPVLRLAHYQNDHPTARILGIRMSAGGGGSQWRNFDGRIDLVRLQGVDYNFEAGFLLADCAHTGDDIAEVQRAVDAAPAGYNVRIRGVCDLSQAAPHGGSTAGITAAAIVLRSGAPATSLTIEPEGGPRTAGFLGSGTQTAILVPPGASGITIRGLLFTNFARPIVVASATAVTIGADVAADTQPGPDPWGNSISGGATLNTGILAVATTQPLTVAFGAAGSRTATYAAAGGMSALRVAGNRIVYETPGAPTAATNLTGVDVRRADSAATLAGVTVSRNAIWYATNELRSFDMNAIRVLSGTQITIARNIVGRPEEAGESSTPIASGGRVGILVRDSSNVVIEANRVSAKRSATIVATPAGGIVSADSTNVTIRSNTVSLAFDDATQRATDDLGVIGVVDNVGLLLGEAASAAPSRNVTIASNVVADKPLGAARGIVIAGSSWVDALNNDVRYSDAEALALGPVIEGADGAALPRAVNAVVACGNVLDGVEDDPNQMSAGAHVSGSNFPGGSLIAGNAECADAGIVLTETGGSTSPVEGGASDTYTVALARRPTSNVQIAISGGSQAGASPANVTFTPDTWALPQTIVIQATQDTVSEGRHLQAVTHTASGSDVAYNGLVRTLLVTIVDDDPGSVFLVESAGSSFVVEGGATDTYTIALGSRPSADVRILPQPDAQLRTSPTSLTFTAATWATPQIVTLIAADDAIREGPHLGSLAHKAQSADANFNAISVAGLVATIGDNDVPPRPVITVPSEGSTIRVTNVVITGTGERAGRIDIREGLTVIATGVVSSQGRFTIGPVAFAEGPHTITATLTDANGFVSPAATRSFRIDLTPPQAPVIIAPAQDAVFNEALITVRGTAEPNATVVVSEGSFSRSVTSDSAGAWSMLVLFAEGEHTIIATGYDGAGNVGPSSLPRSFRINADGTPPAAPVITSPEQGAIVPQTRRGPGGSTLPGFSLTGMTEPGVQVQVWDGGTPLVFDVSNSEGFFDIGLSLAARRYNLSVRAVDDSQNIGPFSAPRTVFVDDSPPTVSVRRPEGQRAITIVPPSEDVVAFGSASDNYGVARVRVTYTDRFGRSLTRDATVIAEGVGYRWEDRGNLDPGEYRVLAIATDVAGNDSRPSAAQMLRL